MQIRYISEQILHRTFARHAGVRKSTGPVVHLFIISVAGQAVWIVTRYLSPAFLRSAGATHHDISLLYIEAGLAASNLLSTVSLFG